MSNWQSFKKKHVLLMNAAFTVAIPAAVWLIMELLNLAFCGVHTLNSTVDYTTLMRNLVTSFCFALGLNCNLPVGRMDTSTGSQMYLACIIGGNIALSLNLGGVGVLVFSMVFGMLAGGFVGFLFKEEAGMKLLFVPYVPSRWEDLLLQGRNIRADVHEFLAAKLPKESRLH